MIEFSRFNSSGSNGGKNNSRDIRFNIIMGNNTTCIVIGIESVQIKMFDGVERILFKVRHIMFQT